MFDNPMLVRKIRQRCSNEEYALKLMRKKKIMTELDLITALTNNGMKKSKAPEVITYLINSHDVKRTPVGLEFIEWII